MLTERIAGSYIERWDINASARLKELREGDASYNDLVSLITDYLGGVVLPNKFALDAGTGLGFLARKLAADGYRVTALDPSAESIRLAREVDDHDGRVTYLDTTLESYHRNDELPQFGLVIANMTLHCLPKLATFMQRVATLLHPQGLFLATIPDPDTYLQGRTDVDLRGIDLRVDQVIEIPFRIHGKPPHPSKVIYFHRPYRTYIAAGEAATLPLSNIQLPEQIGVGRPRDVVLLEFSHERP